LPNHPQYHDPSASPAFAEPLGRYLRLRTCSGIEIIKLPNCRLRIIVGFPGLTKAQPLRLLPTRAKQWWISSPTQHFQDEEMNPIIRFFMSVFAAILASRVAVDAVTQVRMRVLPNDLDFNLHLNNARYLALCDIAGVGFVIRVGLGRHMVSSRLRPLIGGRIIRFRFGLRAFERFTVSTRVLCWDDKWFYFEQRMETKRGIAAIVLTKGLVRDSVRGETIRPDEIVRSLGGSQRTFGITPEVSQWLMAEELLISRTRIDCSVCPDCRCVGPDRRRDGAGAG
jgi:acyl-CoA thioesterase FadM